MSVLTDIQNELKAPKSRFNSFGEYYYRSLEDILETVKPILKKYNAALVITDDIVAVGERYYVKATATLQTESEMFAASAYAREPVEKKKMDLPQITGTASSYARKYALNGLFLIDDTKDPDTDEYAKQTQEVRKERISTTKARAISKELKQRGIEQKALSHYGAKSCDELTEEQHLEIVEMMRKLDANKGNTEGRGEAV